MIRVESLSKRFKLYTKPTSRLVEWVTLNRAVRHTDFWALRELDLTVRAGECVGVIGPNGAGKSTLLKILTGTLAATGGRFEITGRVLSLLELGTGFSAELSGRQNVIETGSLLGFPGGYVRQRIEEIAEFAGIGEFFDRPIKTYSTGMTVRLAFAMFAFLMPDVLIVDEALAVGDVGFQRRCYKKIEELLSSGTTCLMVTHDLPAVVQFCHRAVVLEGGVKTFEGDPRAAVNRLNDLYFGIASPTSAAEQSGDGNATIGELWFEDGAGEKIGSTAAMKTVVFCYAVRFAVDVEAVDFGFHVKTLLGAEVTTAGSEKLGHRFGPMKAGQTAVVRWRLDLTLNPGSYFFGCGVRYHQTDRFLDRRVDAIKFPVADLSVVGGLVNPVRGVSVTIKPPMASAVLGTADNIGGFI